MGYSGKPGTPMFSQIVLGDRRISCMAPAEANLIYREIFEMDCYAIAVDGLPDRPVVLDVGANIGLFSLYLWQRYPGSRILAYEPAPLLAEICRVNFRNWGVVGEVIGIGLLDWVGVGQLHYYPNAPGMSTFYRSAGDSTKLTTAHLIAQGIEPLDVRELVRHLHEELDQVVEVSTLSAEIRARRLDRIDLLKVDVEGAEIATLKGLESGLWPRIERVVVEVEEVVERRIGWLRRWLEAREFSVEVLNPIFSPDVPVRLILGRRDSGLAATTHSSCR